MSSNNFIDFIFIGPSKTASTWIFELLKTHPEISLPNFKESFFFDKFYSRGFPWYRKQFENCDQSKIIGEFSHDYILKDHYLGSGIDAIQNIKLHLPNIKLICCYRNPYERSLSGYYYLKRNGYSYNSLIEACSKHSELIEGSLYHKNIAHVLKHFSSDQLLVLDFSLLKDDPRAFATKIFSFLGIGGIESQLYGKTINPKQEARNSLMAYTGKQIALSIRKFGLHRVVEFLKSKSTINRFFFKTSDSKYIVSMEELTFLQENLQNDLENFLRKYPFSSSATDALEVVDDPDKTSL